MPSPALVMRGKQCQQKIEDFDRLLSKGDKNALIGKTWISI